jgi:hypothetical protein
MHQAATFDFRPHHRNVPAEILLADLRRVAAHLDVRTMSQAAYHALGQFKPLTFAKRFGGWNEALVKAGLKPSRNFRVHAAAVLADLRRVAKKLQTTRLSGTQYVATGKYCLPVVYRHFGDWQGAVQAAGLTPALQRPTTDRQLFDNLETVWRRLGRQPRAIELVPPLSKFGVTPYHRRFGGFTNALRAFTTHMATRQSIDSDQPPPNPLPPLPGHIIRHETSRIVNWKLRYRILDRDHFRCRACGRSPATDAGTRLQVDHIHPWRHGGETVPENLQTLCHTCNGGKSDHDPHQVAQAPSQ